MHEPEQGGKRLHVAGKDKNKAVLKQHVYLGAVYLTAPQFVLAADWHHQHCPLQL